MDGCGAIAVKISVGIRASVITSSMFKRASRRKVSKPEIINNMSLRKTDNNVESIRNRYKEGKSETKRK